ncbi:hypothetical protein EBZ37_15335, partial [bacterium]|nr:hypothetical protein [bacterium]
NLGLGRTTRYQQSKLANAVFSYALRDRLAARNSKIQSLLVHPGVCASNLGQTAADSANSAFGLIMAMIMSQAQSTEDGALPMILAAVEPSPPVFSGPNEGIRWLGLNYIRGYPRELQPEKYCISEENKELLWEKSLEAIGSREWLSDEEVVTVLETKCRAIDLGHPLDSQTIFWPGGEGFSLCMSSHGSNDTGDFYAAGSFSCAEHGGTHIDAPWHFNQDGRTVERLALSELIAKVRVIRTFNGLDSQALARSDERNATVECILAHEKEHGLIPAGCIVCFFTGWSSRYSSGPLAYLGWHGGNKSSFDPASCELDFPGLDPDAARLLVQRRVAGVGIDT